MLLCSEKVFEQSISAVVHQLHNIWETGPQNTVPNHAVLSNESGWRWFKCWACPICLAVIGGASSVQMDTIFFSSIHLSPSSCSAAPHVPPLWDDECLYDHGRFYGEEKMPFPCLSTKQKYIWLTQSDSPAVAKQKVSKTTQNIVIFRCNMYCL